MSEKAAQYIQGAYTCTSAHSGATARMPKPDVLHPLAVDRWALDSWQPDLGPIAAREGTYRMEKSYWPDRASIPVPASHCKKTATRVTSRLDLLSSLLTREKRGWASALAPAAVVGLTADARDLRQAMEAKRPRWTREGSG